MEVILLPQIGAVAQEFAFWISTSSDSDTHFEKPCLTKYHNVPNADSLTVCRLLYSA